MKKTINIKVTVDIIDGTEPSEVIDSIIHLFDRELQVSFEDDGIIDSGYTIVNSTKVKSWDYPINHSYTIVEDKVKVNFVTTLYQTGVYGIVNGTQGMFTPSQLVTMKNKLIKDEKSGLIKDLKFGENITVVEKDGLYIEKS